MGATIIDVKLYGREKSKSLRAAVNTGFVGDLITRPEAIKDVDIELRWERTRTLANGDRVKVRYGAGLLEIMGEVTSADAEIWDGLKLPENVEALIGATALEKLGLKVDPRTKRLEKAELFLL